MKRLSRLNLEMSRLRRAGLAASVLAACAALSLPAIAASAAPQTEVNSAVPEPKTGAWCGVSSSEEKRVCWQATEPVILTISVAAFNVDRPEYIVYNADGSENHRSRLETDGINRVWLGAGESLALTPPNSRLNQIEIDAVRSQTDGAQPEPDELCVAYSLEGDVSCFVVSDRNYALRIVVDERAVDAPEYVVRRDGVDQHGNRALEMDSDGSLIYLSAGEEFFLKSPITPGFGENVIRITNVSEY